LIRTVLNEVTKVEGFIVRQISAIKVGLNGRSNALQLISRLRTLNFLEVLAATSRHAWSRHDYSSSLAVYQTIGQKVSIYSLSIEFYAYYMNVCIDILAVETKH
jgi:hypothetical protein